MRSRLCRIALVLCLLVPATTFGILTDDASPGNEAGRKPLIRHAVYVEGSTLLIFNAISLNYELTTPGLSLRLGVGTSARSGYSFVDDSGLYLIGSCSGVIAMVYLVTGENTGDMAFEMGFGGSVLFAPCKFRSAMSEQNNGTGDAVYPSFAIGFRQQPKETGVFGRCGLSYTLRWGIGLTCGGGISF